MYKHLIGKKVKLPKSIAECDQLYSELAGQKYVKTQLADDSNKSVTEVLSEYGYDPEQFDIIYYPYISITNPQKSKKVFVDEFGTITKIIL